MQHVAILEGDQNQSPLDLATPNIVDSPARHGSVVFRNYAGDQTAFEALPLENGDVILIDNRRVIHGRRPDRDLQRTGLEDL